jgi:hypothetical protein
MPESNLQENRIVGQDELTAIHLILEKIDWKPNNSHRGKKRVKLNKLDEHIDDIDWMRVTKQ